MSSDGQTQISTSSHGTILKDTRLRAPLTGTWPLWDSLYHSPYVTSVLPLHTSAGEAKLKELLAKVRCDKL